MSRGQTGGVLGCALLAIALTSQALSGQGPSAATEDPFKRVRFLLGPLGGHYRGTARQRNRLSRVFDGVSRRGVRQSVRGGRGHRSWPDLVHERADREPPPGWRARETYIPRGPNAFEEIFELAAPGEAFEVYSHARFTRQR